MAEKDDKKQTSGNAAPEATTSADLAVAEAAGISEGEVKALRDEAGVNQLAGHESDIHAWALSPAGKEFAKGEKDRQKKEAEAEKQYNAATNKDGLTEAEAKYREAVNKG